VYQAYFFCSHFLPVKWTFSALTMTTKCLGPIEQPPFYAVRVEPTPLATSLGLLTDEHARVLDPAAKPVPGLYAVGNDMHPVMGGEYPGAGTQLGPGMTFAYLAARHAAGVRQHHDIQRRAA
jgi:predicted oxidoreductase